MEQHDRGGPIGIGEDEPERRRVDPGEIEIGIAEAGMELDRDLLARRLLDCRDDEEVEQRLGFDPQPAVAASCSPDR